MFSKEAKLPDVQLFQSKAPDPLPEVPKRLTNCLKTSVRSGKDANERVINLIALAEERRVCGQGILKWYGGVKQARDPQTVVAGKTS